MHQMQPRIHSPLTNLLLIAAVLFAVIAGAFAGPSQQTNAAAPLTAGNLVVLRVGDGTAALTSAATAAFLDEYTTAGTAVAPSISLPTTASGSNALLTLNGTSTTEGALARSADGRYLTLAGYDAAPGTAAVAGTPSATVNRIVARVDANGAIDTTTRVADAYSAGNIRSAVTNDGTGFWTTGSVNGVRFVPFSNSAAAATTQISSTPTNVRVVNIFGGQLYVSSGSGTFIGVNSIGTGLPTTAAQTTTLLPGLPNTGNPNGYVMLDRDSSVAGVDTLYIADQTSANGLVKYSFDGTTWTARGNVASVLTGLTGSVNGASATFYATSGTGAGNTLVTFTDSAAFNAPISGAFTTLATAPANTAFRGVAFAPVDSTPATATPTDSGEPTATATNTPIPTATNTPTPTSTTPICEQAFTPIYTIQGSGLAVQAPGVVTTQGVVVGDFETGAALQGFYLQDPTGDGLADTSDGIFVFTGSNPSTVSAGQLVRVTGFARERFNLTTLNGSNDNAAAVPAADIIDCGAGVTPAPAEVTMPFSSSTYLERFEGMLVKFPQALLISEYFNFDQFGEVVLALPLDGEPRVFSGTALDAPGAAALARATANGLRRITLDDGRGTSNPNPARHPNGAEFNLSNFFRGGDTVQNAVGVLSYDFSLYRIQPIGPADYVAANPRPAAPEPVGGTLKVGAFNTLNFFLTLDYPTGNALDNKCGPTNSMECRGADSDQPDEFSRQRSKLLEAIKGINADVLGLNELENSTGVEPLADIVSGLNDALGAGTYAYINTGTIGTDAIKVGLIYKPSKVTPIGTFKILDSTVNPDFIDTKSRPVLAQTFEEVATGGRFTIAVNHFKSKGSACVDVGDPDLGDGQGNCSQTRAKAANALVKWLATDPTGSGDSDFLIVGDLNSYAKEDTINEVLAGADDLLGTADDYTNLINQYLGTYAYSYTFDGQNGYLDHALSSASLTAQVTGAAEWHINADEVDLFDYDTSFKQPAQDALFEVNAYRTSDHDPVLVGLNLADEVPTATPTATPIDAPTATPTNTPTNTPTPTNTNTPTSTPVPVLSDVVISQVYGGGGNNLATYRNDFIELYNRGTTVISLNGWSVQYASATGISWAKTDLTGSIAPGGYYLIQEAAGAGGTIDLPIPDAIGNITMGATAGKVALVNSTTALSGACPLGSSVMDFVGFGTTANCFEGSGPTAAPSNTTAVLRLNGGATDTNNNNADFVSGVPNPRNSQPEPTNTPTATNTPTNTPEPTPTNTPEPTPTNTPEPTATNTPEPTATNTPTNTPTATNTPTNTPTATNTPTNTPTVTNTPTNTPTATNTPTNTPTPIIISIIGAPLTSPEGTRINLSANPIGQADLYIWYVTKNNLPYALGSGLNFSFIPNDNGTYAVWLTVRADRATLGTDSKDITVTNVAPTAQFSAPATVRPRERFTLQLALPSDPSWIDQAYGFRYAFDCADGQGWRTRPLGSIICQAPTTTGTITVQGRITDKDGGVRTYSRTVSVQR